MFGTSVFIDDFKIHSFEDVLGELEVALNEKSVVTETLPETIAEKVVNEKELEPQEETPEEPAIESAPQSPHHTAILEQDFLGEYEEYEKLEKHIEISYDIFKLESEGKHIMNEIKTKKGIPEGSFQESIYTTIKGLMRAKLLGTGTLINELINLLDALLFSEIENMTHFYIDDGEYRLVDVYYGQELWITENFIQQQFELDGESKDFEEGEIMLVLCYINNYEKLLEYIVEHAENANVSPFLVRRLISITTQIQESYSKLKQTLTMKLSQTILG